VAARVRSSGEEERLMSENVPPDEGDRPVLADAPPLPAGDPPLAHVIDDTDGRAEALAWAADELLRGRAFEDVSAELAAQGWADEAAGAIVEEAREATRRQRGVRTRDDVARGVARRYARSTRLVRWLVIIGIVAVAVIGSMFLRG
jgi:hypothetical protein